MRAQAKPAVGSVCCLRFSFPASAAQKMESGAALRALRASPGRCRRSRLNRMPFVAKSRLTRIGRYLSRNACKSLSKAAALELSPKLANPRVVPMQRDDIAQLELDLLARARHLDHVPIVVDAHHAAGLPIQLRPSNQIHRRHARVCRQC